MIMTEMPLIIVLFSWNRPRAKQKSVPPSCIYLKIYLLEILHNAGIFAHQLCLWKKLWNMYHQYFYLYIVGTNTFTVGNHSTVK